MLHSHYFYYMVLRTHCLLKNALLSDKFDLRSLDKLTEIGDKFSKFQAKEAKESAGIPIGVQIATLPLHDELALKIMKDIASIKYHKTLLS